MVSNSVIDSVILQTKLKYLDINISNLLLDCIFSKEIPIYRFTRENGARESLYGVKREDFLRFIFENFQKARRYGRLKETNGDVEVFKKLSTEYTDFSILLDTKNPEICSIVSTVVDYLYGYPLKVLKNYSHLSNERSIVYTHNSYVDDPTFEDARYREFAYKQNLERLFDTCKNERIKNIRINSCLIDLLANKQSKLKRGEYVLDGCLYAVSDVGLKKPNQEDSVLVLTHPDDNGIKFLAVADGVGGVESGEIASRYVLKKLSEVFLHLPVDTFDDINVVKKIIDETLKMTDNELSIINQEKVKAATTLTGAIVLKDKTLIANIGDSRAYCLGNDSFKLLTRDDTLAWRDSSPKTVEDIDDLRFAKNSNVLTNCIGSNRDLDVKFCVIDNDKYHTLALMSDGVSDHYTMNQMYQVIRNADLKCIAKNLVYGALTNTAFRSFYDCNHKNKIDAGNDNATVAVYTKRK